jgi:signal transduction histidine kinase
MVVHELRTPLSGINKITELLRNGRDIKKEEFDNYIKMINTDSSNMLDLVNDILDIAKLEAGKFDVKKEMKDILKKHIDDYTRFFKQSAKEMGISYKEYMEGNEDFETGEELEFAYNLKELIKGKYIPFKATTLDELKVEVKNAFDTKWQELEDAGVYSDGWNYDEDWCSEFFWDEFQTSK